MRRLTPVLPVLCVLAAGCGGDDPEPAGGRTAPATEGAPDAAASNGGGDCGRIDVPGHEAFDIMVTGGSCATAKKVAGAAEGRGRTAYEASGFSCTPSDAPSGDTDYACKMAGQTITFRYGTR